MGAFNCLVPVMIPADRDLTDDATTGSASFELGEALGMLGVSAYSWALSSNAEYIGVKLIKCGSKAAGGVLSLDEQPAAAAQSSSAAAICRLFETRAMYSPSKGLVADLTSNHSARQCHFRTGNTGKAELLLNATYHSVGVSSIGALTHNEGETQLVILLRSGAFGVSLCRLLRRVG